MDEDAGVGAIGVLRGQAGTSPVTTMQGARRSWSADEKRRIVEESFRPGASVAVVARRHDLNANLLFTWRRHDQARADLSIPDADFRNGLSGRFRAPSQ